MRCVAPVIGCADVVRVMLCEQGGDGVSLFVYSREEDSGADGDTFFSSVSEAKQAALDAYGVALDDWRAIADPLAHCQHDWIAPVRVVGRASGAPRWGKLEALRDGAWVPLDPA